MRPVPDERGELAVSGYLLMKGYWGDEKKTSEVMVADDDGVMWIHTGDEAAMDADGYVRITGRIKDLIIKGGENIAPREIDEALLGHPAVLEAAAVGIPDRHYGQEIMVCVLLREGMACDEAELRAFATRTLGAYKTPKIFRFVTELPRGPSGKVQRLKLLDLVTP